MRLCRWLDDEPVEQPFAVWLGRMCEEFNCPPSVAYHEWLTAPAGLLEEIIEARAFSRMKAVVDGANRQADIPQSFLARKVLEIETAIANEDIAKQAATVVLTDA